MSHRSQRIKDFKEFFDEVKTQVTELASSEASHKRLDPLFNLCIVSGGRHGGVNDKQIEIFYGNRAIGVSKSAALGKGISTRTETAHGATLEYYLTDDAHVICNLYPATSENQRPLEEAIQLEFIKEPKSLYGKLDGHWKMFIAYMETSCIDGQPSKIQRLRVFFLKNFKVYLVDRTIQEKKIKLFIKGTLKFVFNVGLSGFLLLVIATKYSKEEKYETQAILRGMDSLITQTNNTLLGTNALLEKNAEAINRIDTLSRWANDKGKEISGIYKSSNESLGKTLLGVQGSLDALEKGLKLISRPEAVIDSTEGEQ